MPKRSGSTPSKVLAKATAPKQQRAVSGQIVGIERGYVFGWAAPIEIGRSVSTREKGNNVAAASNHPHLARAAVVEIGCEDVVLAVVLANLPLPQNLVASLAVAPPSDTEFSPNEECSFAAYIGDKLQLESLELWARIANTDHYLSAPRRPSPTKLDQSDQPVATFRWGHAENHGGLKIWGWVIPEDRSERQVSVSAIVGGRVVAHAVANHPTLPGLHAVLGSLGRGFELTLPFEFANGQAHQVQVMDDDGRPIGPVLTVNLPPTDPASWIAQQGLPGDTKIGLAALLNQWRRYVPLSIGFDKTQEWMKAFGAPANKVRTKTKVCPIAYESTQRLSTLNPLDENAIYFFYPDGFELTAFATDVIQRAFSETTSDVIYGDTIRIDQDNQWHPRFHGAWDPYYAGAKPDLLQVFAVRGSTLRKLKPSSGNTCIGDIPWIVAGDDITNTSIEHLPWVLAFEKDGVHALPNQAVYDAFLDARLKAKSLKPLKKLMPSTTAVMPLHFSPPDSWPTVTVIIPTRDRCDLITKCIESLQTTDYPHLKVLVLDNGSTDQDTTQYLESIKGSSITVLRWDYPFNYSAINNYGVEHASSEVICLLNDDIEIINPEWLKAMTTHLMRDDVGIVGAKLLYPNEMIQHAGVLLGQSGLVNHIGTLWSNTEPGYEGISMITREVSAVTGACLLIRKSDYLDVSGLDPSSFSIAFNDVDLCLKIRTELNKRVVYCADTVLTHAESASRGADTTPQKRARLDKEIYRLRQKWGDIIYNDPFYSLNLNLDGASHSGLAFPPRHQK